jgi:hypothetical protein
MQVSINTWYSKMLQASHYHTRMHVKSQLRNAARAIHFHTLNESGGLAHRCWRKLLPFVPQALQQDKVG